MKRWPLSRIPLLRTEPDALLLASYKHLTPDGVKTHRGDVLILPHLAEARC